MDKSKFLIFKMLLRSIFNKKQFVKEQCLVVFGIKDHHTDITVWSLHQFVFWKENGGFMQVLGNGKTNENGFAFLTK